MERGERLESEGMEESRGRLGLGWGGKYKGGRREKRKVEKVENR